MKQRSLFDYLEEPLSIDVAPIIPSKPRRSKADTTPGFSEAKRIKKNNGRYYTPVNIVQQILDLSDYYGPRILRKHIMENSCGDGAFLCEIVERYCAESVNRKVTELKTELETFIHGIEIDSTEREKCVHNLDAVALKYGVNGINWDVICADALTVDRFDGQMDFVVGNPPYVRVHNLGASFDAVKKFELAQDGMTDLFIVFYEIGLRMLKSNGVLGYITPSSFFNSVAGARLRQKIVADNLLVKLLDLKHCQVFEATTYSTVVILSPDASKNLTCEYYEYDAEKKPTLIERLTQNDFYFNGNFYFATRSNLAKLKEILSFASSDKFAVKNGFATLADQFFIGDGKFDFEEFTIPIVKASTGKWSRCFFPYDSNGRLVSFETLSTIPAITTYCEKNSELLRRRSLANPNDWYGFGRTQGLKDVAKNKYAINALIRGVNDIKLTQCPPGSGVYSGLYILTDLPFDELKSWLYSEDFIVYISSLKKYKSGGYYTFSSKDLKTYLEYQWCKREQINRNFKKLVQ